MVRSQSKIRHIQESNKILESRMLFGRRLMEYDIDDDAMNSSIEQELSQVSSEVQEYIPNLNVSTPQSAAESIENTDVCSIGDDVEGYVNKKFGQKIMELFPDKAQEVIKQVAEAINKFIDFISTLKMSELKSFLKTLKSKIQEAKTSKETTTTVSEGVLIREFFGTSMALVTLFGSFTMPALVLTLASAALVTILGIWLVKTILCAFNISFSSKKGCRVKSFSWGQCN